MTKINTIYQRRRRARFYQAGRNSSGQIFVNKKRPQLKGLKGNEYHAGYMRLQRESDRTTK